MLWTTGRAIVVAWIEVEEFESRGRGSRVVVVVVVVGRKKCKDSSCKEQTQ